MIQLDDKSWDKIAGAVVGWRRSYDGASQRVFGRVGPRPDDPIQRDLWDASELILKPPHVPSARERMDAVHGNSPRVYTNGSAYTRVIAELRRGNRTLAAQLLQQDVNASEGGAIVVDPQTLSEGDRGITYRATHAAPAMPETPEQAVRFFMDYGNIERGATPEKFLQTIPRPEQVKAAVLAATNLGWGRQANAAALTLAKHFGFEPQDVNPFKENSTASWVDVLPVP